MPNQRGQLDVNEHYQTSLPHIYAVGDVIGFPALASAAYVQGRYAASAHPAGEAEQSLVQRHSDRHLHQPRDQLARQDRARTDGGEGALRGRPLAVQEPGPRADHRPDGRHAEAAVPPRDAARSSASTASARTPPRSSTSARPSWRSRRRTTRCCTSSTRRSTIRRWPRRIAWRR